MASDVAIASIDHAAGIARLAAYLRVHTTDVDEAADSIGRIFCPHALDPLRHSWPDFHALHNRADYDGIAVNYVAYGGWYRSTRAASIGSFCCRCRSGAGRRSTPLDARSKPAPGRVASLLSPHPPTRMVWQDNCAQLILLVDRRQIERRARPWWNGRRDRSSSSRISISTRRSDARCDSRSNIWSISPSTAGRRRICRRSRWRPCARRSSGCCSPASDIISASDQPLDASPRDIAGCLQAGAGQP